MARPQRSVRVDAQLLDALERLARDRAVPATFAEQVDAGLRLLVAQANDARLRRAAAHLAADRERATELYRRLHAGGEAP
jgi:hypothetical protein